jgi:hypothetical protein
MMRYKKTQRSGSSIPEIPLNLPTRILALEPTLNTVNFSKGLIRRPMSAVPLPRTDNLIQNQRLNKNKTVKFLDNMSHRSHRSDSLSIERFNTLDDSREDPLAEYAKDSGIKNMNLIRPHSASHNQAFVRMKEFKKAKELTSDKRKKKSTSSKKHKSKSGYLPTSKNHCFFAYRLS